MTDFDERERSLERETSPEPDSYSEAFYKQLCDHLLLHGRRPHGGLVPVYADDSTLFFELQTEHFGVVIINDAGVEESHWDYDIADQRPRHRGLLIDHNTILTISFPDMAKTKDDEVIWYHAARPTTLRRGSPVRALYEAASGDEAPHSDNAIFFTASRVEHEPETDPLLKEVAKALNAPPDLE